MIECRKCSLPITDHRMFGSPENGWEHLGGCPSMCLHCGEQVPSDIDSVPIYDIDGKAHATHRECALREVLGGIGHLIAHEYWCQQMHDPDGGLTRRQSSLLAARWVEVVGWRTDV